MSLLQYQYFIIVTDIPHSFVFKCSSITVIITFFENAVIPEFELPTHLAYDCDLWQASKRFQVICACHAIPHWTTTTIWLMALQ